MSYIYNMHRYIRLLIVILILQSCKGNRNIPASEYEAKNKNLLNDTLFIYDTSAVMYSPDSLRIAIRKGEVREEDFYAGADDYLFYMNLAGVFLDSVGLKQINSEQKSVLKFILKNGTDHVVKLDTLSELWGIYFFTPDAKPRLIDVTAIEEEYKAFFE